MNIVYNDRKKDLPSDQLRHLFEAVGWCKKDGEKHLNDFNIGHLNSALVVSAWDGERLVGSVRVISDRIFRSVIEDLVVDPEYQNRGIGTELVKRCFEHYPNSEWLVQTETQIAGYYEKLGFRPYQHAVLTIPCKYFPEK